MLHHRRVKPPGHDYPPDEWSVIEKNFHPEFLAQTESIMALGNGYLGMRGSPEEGGPCVQNGTFVNGFHESWPIVYGEEAFGFAKNGQTMLNVTDSKVIRLIVDDEVFWLGTAHITQYDRRLNMKAGTLDREVVWETLSGKLVEIRSRRLISFQQRHVAVISYEVTLRNAPAFVVISSGLFAPQPGEQKAERDPRHATTFGKTLRHRSCQAKGRRVILVHGTERTGMLVACGMDHDLETDCSHHNKTEHSEDYGQVDFTIEA